MNGGWLERLEAIAAGREVVAVAGWRDAPGVTGSRVHVLPVALLDGKAAGWSLDAGAAVRALGFAGDELLVTGGDDGRVIAWDLTGQRALATIELGAPVRALAIDGAAQRSEPGAIAVGTADGALHVIGFAIAGGTPRLAAGARRPLSDGAIAAVAFDPAGLVVAGAADGQLWIAPPGELAAARAVSPGGDGGIRAIACLGDGRAAIGCGDGSIRLCFVVGDVEAIDRSGDHGHAGAVRGLALGPVIVDDAGREQPRRLVSVGDDGAIKSWLIDGARRPRTLEPGAGPLAAIAYQHGAVAKTTAIGRLWIASAARVVVALPLGPDAELGEPQKLGSALDQIEAELRDPRAAVKVKLDAVERLAGIAEDEARVLLDLALATAPPEVQIAATRAMVRSERRQSRPAVRAALSAAQPELRAAAFSALLELERDQPLAALRPALKVASEDVRARAVDALAPLAKTSVIAAGMIADALRDNHPAVRRRAFQALRQVSTDPIDAIRTALARGTPDVRAEALLHLGFVVRAADPPARALAASALDDADPGVRTSAFLAAVMQRPRLAARLDAVVPSLKQAFAQVAGQLGTPLALPPDPGVTLDDDELEPVFAALACRAGDAAIRGAGCLLALGDPRALGAVLQLTREADPALRRGATANLIGAIARWPDDDRLSARLTWLLDDGDADVRAFAFDALAKLAVAGGASGELAFAELALRCSQEDIRVRALQILVRAGAPGTPAHARADALLGDALDDEAAKVRLEAFRTLWAWHTADPETPIARGAASRHADLRAQVVAEIERRRQAKQATPAMERQLVALVRDPSPQVGLAAFAALTKAPDGSALVAAPEVYVAAMESPAAQVRAAGAAGARHAPASAVRARLVKLIEDDHPPVHLAAIEALDAVAPNDAEGFALALGSIFYELRVRAGELCGDRRDVRASGPMQKLLAIGKTDFNRPSDPIRQRAARALGSIGDASAIGFLQGLVDDDDPLVREMAARGLATAAQPGSSQALAALLALLGHGDLAVRSWGGEGLAKLGDLRALPVLAGTQRHDHRPLRIGAIVGFVALGPDGVRGLRQGLEDKDREIADLAFAVIVARDAALAEAGIAPDLLVDAMASPSAEIRFAAARLYERRARGERADDVIAELVGPRQPEKAADMKDWPPPPRRSAMLAVVGNAIASDDPGQRYAATQVLALRPQPLTFWREAARLSGPARGAPIANTTWSTEARLARKTGWLRRLVGERREPEATELEGLARLFLRSGAPAPIEAAAAQRLVFGVYAGLVRQAPAGEVDETHRVRRDAVARLVELARQDAVGADAVLPVLRHALGDPHHLVRQAAMAALRSLYPTGALAPLAMAIDAAPDLGKAAIDELVPLAEAGDDRAAELVRRALDADAPEVRAHAALRLPRLYPAGSAEPQLVAARSKFGDIRLGAISQLATAPEQTSAIHDALVGSLASEHADLRLAAAIALARRGDPLGIDVLAGFLRGDDHGRAALAALVALADRPASAGAAAEAIAARLDDDPERTADRKALIAALGKLHHEAGAPSLVRLLVAVQAGKEGELADLVEPVLAALGEIVRDRTARMQLLPDGRARARYREDLAIAQLGALAQSPLPAARLGAALRLGNVDDRRAEDVLARLIGDRAPEVRVAAAQALALRAEYVPGATLAALESALRGGRRELVLPAAEGLAARKRPEAFQPLLLVAKAGLPDEQQRALVALGGLGDRRALEHLRPLLDPEVDDEHSRALRSAAIEALGRLAPALEGDEAAEVRARLERFALGGATAVRSRAMIALRFAGMLGLVERVASDREAEGAVRVIAVRELGIARAASSEPVLVELLGDEDGAVRAAAVKALGDVLGGDRTRLSLYALGSKHDDVSAPAARYLAGQGDPATLVARLGQVISADVRRMLREGLIRRAALPVRELDAALRGGDPRPRAEAAWLAGYGGDAAHGLGDAVAAAVAASAAGWTEAAGGRGGAARQADQAHAWRAALWAAGRVGASAAAAGASAVANERAPAEVRRAAIGLVVSGEALGNAVGDADREVRAVASAALAARGASSAAAIVRGLGARADATTIAPLALSAWRELAAPLVAEPSTRAWALAVALAGRTVAELVAIASARGEDPARLAAIAALGRIGGDEAKAVLERIHRDAAEPDAVKLAAWKALRRALRADRTYAEGRDKGKRGEHAPAEADAVDDDEDDDDDDDDDDGGDDGGGDDGGDEDDDDDEEDEEDEDEDDDE